MGGMDGNDSKILRNATIRVSRKLKRAGSRRLFGHAGTDSGGVIHIDSEPDGSTQDEGKEKSVKFADDKRDTDCSLQDGVNAKSVKFADDMGAKRAKAMRRKTGIKTVPIMTLVRAKNKLSRMLTSIRTTVRRHSLPHSYQLQHTRTISELSECHEEKHFISHVAKRIVRQQTRCEMKSQEDHGSGSSDSGKSEEDSDKGNDSDGDEGSSAPHWISAPALL